VFEVSYLDPNSATGSDLNDTTPPEISDVTISLPGLQVQQVAAAAQQIKVKANVHDEGGSTDPIDVRVTYTNDGRNWHFQPLSFNAASGLYEAALDPPPTGGNIAMIVEARDGAGNIASYTSKGVMESFSIVALPLMRK
jgi:hypothetical protein